MRAAQLPQERFSPVTITYGTWLRAVVEIGQKVSQRLLSGMRLGRMYGCIGSEAAVQVDAVERLHPV